MDREKDLTKGYKEAFEILKSSNELVQKFDDLLKLRIEILIEKDKYFGKLLDNLFYSFLLFITLLFFIFIKTWWALLISISCLFFIFYFLNKAKKYKNPIFEYNIKLKAIETILFEIYKKILEKN